MLPSLALFAAAACFSYFSNIKAEQWLQLTVWILCGIVAFFFWLIPVIRHLSFYLDVSTSRLIIRQGLFGGKSIEVSFANLISAASERGGKLVLQIQGQEPVELKVPGRKKLAETINRLANKRQ